MSKLLSGFDVGRGHLAVRRAVSRGLSLVELMVGIAVGLFIVAAATVMATGQLGENRRLLLESQLQQDLRATSDIITRELRRSGAIINAQNLAATASAPAQANVVTALTPASGAHSEVVFRYERNLVEQGPWGFKLDGGVIKTQLVNSLTGVSAGWQDLTDGTVMEVTLFRVTIVRSNPVELACPKICPAPANDTSCWPQMVVRDFLVEIEARLRSAPEVRRSVRSIVRARNEAVEFRTGGPLACPA